MLSREDNELLTRIGPGTPMGNLMRRYWIPALFSDQLPEPDGAPVRVKLLGEKLVAFRDTQGRVGLIDDDSVDPRLAPELLFQRPHVAERRRGDAGAAAVAVASRQ